jgi:hypothetical protein
MRITIFYLKFRVSIHSKELPSRLIEMNRKPCRNAKSPICDARPSTQDIFIFVFVCNPECKKLFQLKNGYARVNQVKNRYRKVMKNGTKRGRNQFFSSTAEVLTGSGAAPSCISLEWRVVSSPASSVVLAGPGELPSETAGVLSGTLSALWPVPTAPSANGADGRACFSRTQGRRLGRASWTEAKRVRAVGAAMSST